MQRRNRIVDRRQYLTPPVEIRDEAVKAIISQYRLIICNIHAVMNIQSNDTCTWNPERYAVLKALLSPTIRIALVGVVENKERVRLPIIVARNELAPVILLNLCDSKDLAAAYFPTQQDIDQIRINTYTIRKPFLYICPNNEISKARDLGIAAANPNDFFNMLLLKR